MSQAEVHIKTCGKQEGEEDQDEDEEEIRDDDKEEISDDEDEEDIRDEDEKEEEEEEEGEEVYQCGECDLILSDYESMQVCTWVSNSIHILFKSFKLILAENF